jgi:hypothetical protein
VIWNLIRNGFAAPKSTLIGAIPVVALALGHYFQAITVGWWAYLGAGIIAAVGWAWPAKPPTPPTP